MENGLKKSEIKILKYIHKAFKGSTPKFISFKAKMEELGFEIDEISQLYRLYVNNHREDGDYENISEPNRSDIPIIEAIREVIKNPRMDYDEMYTKFIDPKILGDWFSDGGYTTIDVDDNGLYLYMKDEDFEKYFDGMSNEDRYVYNNVNSYYSYPSDQDSDEFNYALRSYPQEYRENIHKLANMVGDISFAEDVLNNTDEDGDFKNFLEEKFPIKYDEIESDYLYNLAYAYLDAQKRSVNKCYEENINFKSTGRENLFIPWKELLELIMKNDEIITLSDLKDADINGDYIGLEDCYTNAYPTDEDMQYTWDELNKHIEKLIDDLEYGDEDVAISVKNAAEMIELLTKLGFKKEGKTYNKKNTDGVNITINSFDVEKSKFNITVIYPEKYAKSKWGEGQEEKMIIDVKDLASWVTSIPLSRQLESYRKILKKILKEWKNNT